MRPFDPALLRQVPAARLPVLALGVLGVVTGALAIAQAVTLAWLVTVIVAGEPLRTPAVVLLALLVARGVVTGVAEVVSGWAGQRVAAGVRRHLLRRWLRLPEEDRPAAEQAVTRATEGVASIEPYVARYLPALVAAAVVPALAVATLLVVDVWSALIVVLTLPLLPLFAALVGQHTRDETQRRWVAMEALAGHFLDVVQGLPTLVAYGRAEHQAAVVHEVGQRHRRATVRTLRTAFLSTAALELLATISVAMVAVGVGLRLAVGWTDLQVALTAILLAPEAYWPIRRVGAEFHTAADGATALESSAAELGTDEQPAGPCTCTLQPTHDHDIPAGSCTCTLQPTQAAGGVTVTGLSYTHAGRRTVLNGLDLQTASGPGLTALTGTSGVGKTTLLDVLAGVRRATAGAVSVPGPVHYATQRPLLIPGSVRGNLRLAAPGLTDGEARVALGRVGLWSDLSARAGLETTLGDDGFGLSAGQRSRLALARALLSDAPVVLLDEPTAHMTAASLPRLHEVVLDLATHRRVVVATHDPILAGLAEDRWHLDGVGAAVLSPDHPLWADPPAAPPTQPTATAPPILMHQQPTAPRRGRLAWACLLGGLATSSGVALTATSGWLIVQASTGPVILTLLVAIVGVRAFGIGRPLLRYAERIVSHDVALAELAARRTEVYRRLIPLTPARLGRRGRAEVLTAVVRDLDDVVQARVRVSVPLWSTALASAVAVVIVGALVPAAGAVLLLGGLTAYGVGLLGQHMELRAQTSALLARGRSRSVATAVAGQLGAFRAVLGGHVEEALTDLGRAHRDEERAVRRITTLRGLGIAGTWSLVGVVALLVAGLATQAYAAGAVSAPVAALLALTTLALAEAWTALPEAFGLRARAMVAARRLESVLQQEPAVRDVEGRSGSLLVGTPQLELEDVAARWSETGAPDLRGLDLDLAPGARIALTGPNGAGKSTLLAVLARHLDPVGGTYRHDLTDVRQLPLEQTRARLALVDHEPHAFAGTVRANLLLARPEADDVALCGALDTVALTDWLTALPQGLDTPLTGLSGGERTRLALARAVLAERPVLLLDEPTAHLDGPTARTVLASVLDHAEERSVVLVTHDLVGFVSDQPGWASLTLQETGAPLGVVAGPVHA